MEFLTISSLLKEHSDRSFEAIPRHVEAIVGCHDENGVPITLLFFSFQHEGVLYSNAVQMRVEPGDTPDAEVDGLVAFKDLLELSQKESKAVTFNLSVPPGDSSCMLPVIRPTPAAEPEGGMPDA